MPQKQNALINIALYQPEIPPNTGNIIRLCANTGMQLHLIKPLSFELDDKQLRRAGLDYHEWTNIKTHDDYHSFLKNNDSKRIFALSTKGTHNYTDVDYQANDTFLFGPETRGLPANILDNLEPQHILRIPMMPNSRSLNLSNAVAILVYEAWRQLEWQICS